MPAVLTKQSLRKTMCLKRSALSLEKLTQSATSCTHLLKQLPILTQAQHIAAYLPHNGEMDVTPFIKHLQKAQKNVYLPVLNTQKPHHLHFAKFTQKTQLIKNRYGILEPDTTQTPIYPTDSLDVVLAPVVAFDKALNRLGMGGGFYDTTFFSLKTDNKPTLIGIAYEFQKTTIVPHNDLDVPMDLIVTEKKTYEKTTF